MYISAGDCTSIVKLQKLQPTPILSTNKFEVQSWAIEQTATSVCAQLAQITTVVMRGTEYALCISLLTHPGRNMFRQWLPPGLG